MPDLNEIFHNLLQALLPDRATLDRLEAGHTLFEDLVPQHLQPIVGLVSIGVVAPFLALGIYHFYMTLQHRNGHWTGYYLPLVGPFLNVALDKEGRRHRTRSLLYLAIVVPFMMLILPQIS